MGARVLRVYASPEEIVANRPKKPVRGRKARIAAYAAQREAEKPAPAEEPHTPRKAAVEVVQGGGPARQDRPPVAAQPVEKDNESSVPEVGPIIPARFPVYPPRDTIPYCLDQPYK